MAHFFCVLLMAATFWPHSLQAHTRNVCEGQPDAEVVTQRLLARSSEAAAAGATQVSVNVNTISNESSMRSFDVKTISVSDSSKVAGILKVRPTRVTRLDTTFLCPWVYRIQKINSRYLPSYIVWAELLVKPEQPYVYNYNGHLMNYCHCAPIVSDLPVLRFSSCVNGTERWKLDTRRATVGFTCVNTI